MPKKTIILILFLVAFSIGMFYIASREKQLKQSHQSTPHTSTKQNSHMSSSASLSFLPGVVHVFQDGSQNSNASSSSMLSSNIVLDTQDSSVSTIQVELSFDPFAFSFINIGPPQDAAFFGTDYTTLFREINESSGRISYAIHATKDYTSNKKSGFVAQISFTLNPAYSGPSTQIVFLDKSMVSKTDSHESILEKTTPLTIQVFPPPQTTLEASVSAQ